MRRILFVIAVLLVWNASFGQLFERVYYVSGRILDEETKKPVPYVLVVNIKKGNATQSDTAGRFLIAMTRNDTLRLSCLGYKTQYWTLSDKNPRHKHFQSTIYMTKRVYKLPAVDVFAVRWKIFVYQVAHTQVEKDQTQQQIQVWIDKAISKEDLRALTVASRGVGFVFGGKTKYEKQLQKMKKIQHYAEMEKRIEQKFNPQIVSTVTGLQGKELEKFMDYLNFDRDFILKTPQYDLVMIIKQIYDEYKKGNLQKREEIINSTPFTPKKKSRTKINF